MVRSGVNDILDKYGRRLEEGSLMNSVNINRDFSREFSQFKQDMMPQLSRYERWCNNIGNMLKLKLASKDEEKLQKEINGARISVNPSQVTSLAFLSFVLVFILGLLVSVAIYLITFGEDLNLSPIFLIFLLFLLAAGFLFYYFYTMPSRLANQWRLKAGSQMVPCILYTVIYMKHTPNLERAIHFASQHLDPPLAFDLKKVFWDVQVGKYSTITPSFSVGG